MLRQLSVLAARTIPVSAKNWIHRNRTLDNASRKVFAFLCKASDENVAIEGGPMRGIKLRMSEHVSHAHIGGTYELETQQAIDKLLVPGSVCYDLGASIGYFSLLMARKARQVYAFEPAPHAAAELVRHAAANGFQNITVEPSPVSDQRRRVKFCLTDVAYGSSIVEEENQWPSIDLTAITLDEFVETLERIVKGASVVDPALIQELVGHRGQIVWDSSRPDGQPTRYLDVSRARDWLGFEAGTPLRAGLRSTIESFRNETSNVA